MAVYLRHCNDCGEHAETSGGPTGMCGYCRSIDTVSHDRGAELGCEECSEYERDGLEAEEGRQRQELLVAAREALEELTFANANRGASEVLSSKVDLRIAHLTKVLARAEAQAGIGRPKSEKQPKGTIGISLRDLFAAAAVQALAGHTPSERLGAEAYRIADATLAHRKRVA